MSVKALLILPIMVFLHILVDFHIQGVLAEMKQKKFWEKFGGKYAEDYMVAMGMHSFEWIFVVSLPMLLNCWIRHRDWAVVLYFVIIIANMVVHYVVDDMKANDLALNLAEDQMCHLVQILCAWLAWTIIVGWI